jgi:hypothetical protein
MENNGLDYVYVLGDGDNIRERIEYYLLGGEIEALAKLSQLLIATINAMGTQAIEMMKAEVLIAGGDDIFFRVDPVVYKLEIVKQLAAYFQAETECTFSFGVGRTIEVAYLGLRRAKAMGKGRIVEDI